MYMYTYMYVYVCRHICYTCVYVWSTYLFVRGVVCARNGLVAFWISGFLPLWYRMVWHGILCFVILLNYVGFRNFIAFFWTRPWRDELLMVSPRLGGCNINSNPGIETLESRLWRACPVPGLFPVPGLCRLSGCFLNVYSITSWFVIICYFIFCSTALYYNMLFVLYYVLCMRFLFYVMLYFIT